MTRGFKIICKIRILWFVEDKGYGFSNYKIAL